MLSAESLRSDINLARRELKNIRQDIFEQKSQLKWEVERIKSLLLHDVTSENGKCSEKGKPASGNKFPITPVGFISSCFKNKNGIPRQASLGVSAKAILKIDKTYFTNPEHALIGLDGFPFIWILFLFHKNGIETSVKAKVHPPGLNGVSVGVFSTRSPHRPSSIGLSLTKLDKIEGNTLFLSGVDMLDGTPVLDIKPYILYYDSPSMFTSLSISEGNCSFVEGMNNIQEKKTSTADDEPPIATTTQATISSLFEKPFHQLEVIFTMRATLNLKQFHACDFHEENCPFCLSFLHNAEEASKAIVEILQNDPRSVYRRKKCPDKIYYFNVDSMHVTSWFDDSTAEVLKIKPAKGVNSLL